MPVRAGRGCGHSKTKDRSENLGRPETPGSSLDCRMRYYGVKKTSPFCVLACCLVLTAAGTLSKIINNRSPDINSPGGAGRDVAATDWN